MLSLPMHAVFLSSPLKIIISLQMNPEPELGSLYSGSVTLPAIEYVTIYGERNDLLLFAFPHLRLGISLLLSLPTSSLNLI